MFMRIIALLICLMGMFTREAWSQLFLEDGKKVLAVSAGDHLDGSLLIHNTSGDPSQIKVYWEDFEYRAPYDGSKNFLPAGTAPASASQWVSFSPQGFTMPGYGQQRVDYTVTVPSSIKEGHYGVLFFEKSTEPLKGEAGLTLVTRVGCLFFIEPKDKNKNALLQDIGVKAHDITANFVNQGNVILLPRTTYYLMQDSGLVVLRGEAKKLYVPPGAAAALDVSIKDQLKPGQYTLVVNCDLGEGDVVVKEIDMSVDDSGQIKILKTQD